MGWTHTNLYGQKTRDYLIDLMTGRDHRVLDIAICKRRVAYAAVEVHRAGDRDIDSLTKPRYVYAAVFLLRYPTKSEYNFAYKDMDEGCGPFEVDCPERILKLLTPTDSEFALKWRKNCRTYHEQRKKKLSTTKQKESRP
jgi:hypothetical protein